MSNSHQKTLAQRLTRNQQHILDLVKQLDQPLSAQQLYVRLRDAGKRMGLATVYRALETLKREGLIQSRTLGTGESVYSSIKEDRHHFTCVQCGNSIPIDECPVHDLEEKLNAFYRFKTYYHVLEFFGLCDQCQCAGHGKA